MISEVILLVVGGIVGGAVAVFGNSAKLNNTYKRNIEEQFTQMFVDLAWNEHQLDLRHNVMRRDKNDRMVFIKGVSESDKEDVRAINSRIVISLRDFDLLVCKAQSCGLFNTRDISEFQKGREVIVNLILQYNGIGCEESHNFCHPISGHPVIGPFFANYCQYRRGWFERISGLFL